MQQFENVNAVSTELLLDSLSLNVIKESILKQITGRIQSTTDFFTIVKNKFNTIIDDVTDGEIVRELQDNMIEFCSELIDTIGEQFDLCLDYNHDSLEVISTFNSLYNFFIIDRTEIVEDFIFSYIKMYKDVILDSIGIDDKSNKDITSIANKRKNVDKNNIQILSHLNEIINFVIGADIDTKEFLNIIDDGEVTKTAIISMVSNFVINGDFAPNYIHIIGDYSDERTSYLRNSLRTRFSI